MSQAGQEIGDRDLRDLVNHILNTDPGWRYDDARGRGGHPMLFPADKTHPPIRIPTTPRNPRRALKNLRAEARRAGATL